MNTFHNSLRDHLTDQEKAAILLSATCEGNDPELPPCPLFHGSLGPMLFADIEGDTETQYRFHSARDNDEAQRRRQITARVDLQSLLLESHNITWAQHVYFPSDEEACNKICGTLAKTRYSSRSITSVTLEMDTLAIAIPFLKNHCRAIDVGVRIEVDKDDTDEVAVTFSYLSQLTFIKELAFPKESKLTRADVNRLLQLKSLQHATNANDSHLQHLSKLLTLRHVAMASGATISVGGFKFLSKLRNLQALDLSGNESIVDDDDWFAHLTELQSLTKLILRHTKISSLKNVSRIVSLEYLDLNSTRVREISDLVELHRLRHLNLESTGINCYDGLESISELEALTFLDVSYCDLSYPEESSSPSARYDDDDDFEACSYESPLVHIGKLSELRHLNLSHCTGVDDDKDLSHLSSLEKIEFLDLSYMEYVGNAGVKSISCLSSLRELNLSGNYESLSATGIGYLTYLPLERLHLDNCHAGDEELSHLSEIPTLEELYMRDSGILHNKGFKHLAEHPSLRVLGLQNENCWEDTGINRGIGYLSTIPFLEALDIRGYEQGIDDDGLWELRDCRCLRWLNIGIKGMGSYLQGTYQKLKKKFPGLVITSMNSREIECDIENGFEPIDEVDLDEEEEEQEIEEEEQQEEFEEQEYQEEFEEQEYQEEGEEENQGSEEQTAGERRSREDTESDKKNSNGPTTPPQPTGEKK